VIQDSTNFAKQRGRRRGADALSRSEYVDLGVKIKATPTLHPNNEVTLLLEFEIRSLAGSSGQRDSRHLQSNADANRSRQTGRTDADWRSHDAEETRSITGLPGFAEIPIAGYAFGSRKEFASGYGNS